MSLPNSGAADKLKKGGRMSELIKIGNQNITTKEYGNKRVVTFKDIDLVHERPEGTADRNFRENKDKFIEGEDYVILGKSQNNEIRGLEIPNRGITLITEQGYLMLVKSLTDELAWQVQRELVNNYFRVAKPMTAMELLELQMKATKEVSQRVDSVNDDLQSFKRDMPILGIEESRITGAVRKRGVQCLGGKESTAYQDKSLRSRVYSDIYGQLKREFGIGSYKAIKRSQCDVAVGLIETYELPYVLAEEIKDCNAQMAIFEPA